MHKLNDYFMRKASDFFFCKIILKRVLNNQIINVYRLDVNVDDEAWAYAVFLFQMSLATTASTIVSGS